MPVHDWTRVDAGTFHAFHMGWVLHLSETLNAGLLPPGYYAMPEQHMGRRIGDVLTLSLPSHASAHPPADGGVAVAEHPPKVSRKLSVAMAKRAARRTLAIRHVSDHRIVALVEIISPANKDRRAHVEEFLDKAENALIQDVNLLLIDLLPPGKHDPGGMHACLLERFDDEPYQLPADKPLTTASYVAGVQPDVYVEHLATGNPLVDMPLFLNPDRYVYAPLEKTYQMAYQGMPAYWRDVLERP